MQTLAFSVTLETHTLNCNKNQSHLPLLGISGNWLAWVVLLFPESHIMWRINCFMTSSCVCYHPSWHLNQFGLVVQYRSHLHRASYKAGTKELLKGRTLEESTCRAELRPTWRKGLLGCSWSESEGGPYDDRTAGWTQFLLPKGIDPAGVKKHWEQEAVPTYTENPFSSLY